MRKCVILGLATAVLGLAGTTVSVEATAMHDNIPTPNLVGDNSMNAWNQ